MTEQPMIGCRVSQEWKATLETIALNSGRQLEQVVYEAIAQYLAEAAPQRAFHQAQASQIQEIFVRLAQTERQTSRIDILCDQIVALSARLAALEQGVIDPTLLPTRLATGNYHTNAASLTEHQAVVEAIASLEDIEDEPDEILYDFLEPPAPRHPAS
jgi:phosphoglycolate phosphatase-like HAD superfamily hydrolase